MADQNWIVIEKNFISDFKSTKMFHDDTMKSFFRRMTYSPDGLLMFAPCNNKTERLKL